MSSVGEEAVGPVLEAISLGRTDILRTLLEEVRAGLDKTSMTQEEKVAAFHHFLDDTRNDDGSFIHIATRLGKQDIILSLLQLGADPSVLNSRGEILLSLKSKELERIFLSPILSAVATSNDLLVKRLLDAGVDVTSIDSEESRNSLLHWATRYGDEKTVRLLVERGADVNARDKNGATPLHEAIYRKSEELTNILIESGADVNIKAMTGPFEGNSPLDILPKGEDSKWFSSVSNGPTIANGFVENSTENSEMANIAQNVQEMLSISSNEISSKRTLSLTGPVSPLAPVITDERLNLLWPQPCLIKQLVGEPFLFPNELPLTISPGGESVHKVLDVIELHRHRLRALNRRVFLNENCPVDDFFNDESSSVIHCSIRESFHHVKGSYNIHVSESKIRLTSCDLAGLHYAFNTLMQMFSLFKEEGLIPVVIADQPQFAVRGILLDMNPFGRVPNFEILLQLVEILSYLKVNQLQSYIRLSRDSEWSFSYSKSDVMSIHRHCHERFISFIPAIDVDSSFTIDDLRNLGCKIQDVIKCFDNPKFLHVGPVLTALVFGSAECNRLINLLFPNIANLLVCGNSLKNLKIIDIPTNMTALQYGFKMNSSFTSALSSLQDVGIGIGICAGTGAWSNLAGSPATMLSNVFSGHHALTKLHGNVSVVAHWSSDPTFCHSIFAWPGFVTSAGLAWNPSTPMEYIDFALEDLINVHVVGDSSFPWGRIILDLGKAEHIIESGDMTPAITSSNQNDESIFLKLLLSPDDLCLDNITVESIGASMQHIRRAQTQLMQASSSSLDVRLEAIRHELQLTSDLLLVSARIVKALIISGTNPSAGKSGLPVINCGISNLAPTFKTDMANKLLSLVEQYRALWLLRYHAPGLHNCLRTLNSLLKMFIPEGADMIL